MSKQINSHYKFRRSKTQFEEFDNNILTYILDNDQHFELVNIWRNDSTDQHQGTDFIYQFYNYFKEWGIKWRCRTDQANLLTGSVKILPIEDVLNWRALDLFTPEFPQMEFFTLLDYFDDNAAVGFYLNKPERGLFYFAFYADPKPLNLDFKGYLEMIKYTKGAAFWQLACIEPIDRTTCRTIEKLNQLDPKFSVQDFFVLFDSVRIGRPF